ncbi:M48 family metalloprotease [Streptomyces sp. NPDC020707]|uniref:M48 family metalloprotease n=1 Tax=Streptomyces sp. NPDC020707 TaxID=3365084 RepID=UPI0037B446D2
MTLSVGLSLRAVRVLVSSSQNPELPDTSGNRHRGPLPLSTLRLVKLELARPYEAEILDNIETIAVTAGVLMLLTATALYLFGPALRGRRLKRIGPDRFYLCEALLQLTHRAGANRMPAFYVDPLRSSTGAVAFGSVGRYRIALDNGLVAMFEETSRHGLCTRQRLHCPTRELGLCWSPDRSTGHDDDAWHDMHCAPSLCLCPWRRQSDRDRRAPDSGNQGQVHDDGPDLSADFSPWFQQSWEGAIFAAVVLHELAHLRSRDVELGGAVRALWLAFLATTVLPYTAMLAWLSWGELSGTRHSGAGQQWLPLWEAAVVAVLVAVAYAAYTDILRHRELCADLDAVDWGADPEAWSVVAEEQISRRMGPKWELDHWHTEPDDGWFSVLTWARKTRPLRAGTRPWQTHPGWWWRIRALKRPIHPVGPNGTWTQATILTGTVTAVMHMLLNELAHAAELARLTSTLFYCGMVLCVSLGRPLTVHPSHPFRPQPRTFGVGSRDRTRRAALLGGCVLLLIVTDPLGGVFAAG